MKKLLVISLLSLNLFALDQSVSAGTDQSYKEDKSMGYNKNMSVDNSSDKTTSNTDSKEQSLNISTNVSRVEQISSLVGLMALEKAGIKPFSECQVLSHPKLANDFDLSCSSNGFLNEGRCSFLGLAAQSNMELERVTSKSENIKSYAACVGLYGALIAQDMKYDKFSPELYDKDLIEIFKNFNETLEEEDCRLNSNASTIVCGTTMIKIDYEPIVVYSGISLYSDKTYFGYSSTQSKDKSKRISKAFSESKSKRRSKSNSLAKSLNTNTAFSVNVQKASSVNLSLSKFLPAD